MQDETQRPTPADNRHREYGATLAKKCEGCPFKEERLEQIKKETESAARQRLRQIKETEEVLKKYRTTISAIERFLNPSTADDATPLQRQAAEQHEKLVAYCNKLEPGLHDWMENPEQVLRFSD